MVPMNPPWPSCFIERVDCGLAELGGWIALFGVDLTSMTALHLAEKLAGRHLFRRWANGPDGRVMMVETGSCSRGFGKLDPVLAPVEQRVRVGQSPWRIFPANDALHRAVRAIRQEPRITHCGRADCGRCNDAVQGGPVVHHEPEGKERC
jgi:aminoglycoside N3'-acetyltransferase